jgi:hypothetical protein
MTRLIRRQTVTGDTTGKRPRDLKPDPISWVVEAAAVFTPCVKPIGTYHNDHHEAFDQPLLQHCSNSCGNLRPRRMSISMKTLRAPKARSRDCEILLAWGALSSRRQRRCGYALLRRPDTCHCRTVHVTGGLAPSSVCQPKSSLKSKNIRFISPPPPRAKAHFESSGEGNGLLGGGRSAAMAGETVARNPNEMDSLATPIEQPTDLPQRHISLFIGWLCCLIASSSLPRCCPHWPCRGLLARSALRKGAPLTSAK